MAVAALAGVAAAADRPDTTLTTTTPSLTTSRSATFNWAASDATSTFECSLDGTPFSACTAPRTYNGLPTGEHTFQVRAIAGGLEDLTPAAFTWTIEGTPDTIIFSFPPASTLSTSATFGWSSDLAFATFECALDSAPWTACSSPRTYNGVAFGSHTLRVRASKAGLTDATPAAYTWTVQGPPETTISSAPSGITVSRSATIVWSSSKVPATHECSIDNGLWETCSSPRTYNGLTVGTHFVKVRSTWSGLVDATPAVASWTIEGTPQTFLTSSPVAITPLRSATLTWVADLAFATFECSLDGAAYSPCSSPRSYSGLSLGTHSFSVRASKGGLTDATPASASWRIEGTPQTSLTTVPPATTPLQSATLTWSADLAASTFECKLDASAWAPCSSPRTYNGLPRGPHAFSVRASKWGFTDATPATTEWTIEGTPETTITVGPDAVVGFGTATLQWTSSLAFSTFECKLDAADWEPCSSPRTYNGLGTGPHAFFVRASKWGFTDATPAQRNWLQEGTPETTLTGDVTPITLSRDASFSWSSSLPLSTFECSFDGSLWAACSSPRVYHALAYGTHALSVRAVKWGRADLTPASIAWRVDPPEPTTTLTSTPAATIVSRSATFTWVSDQATATFECSLDGQPYSACSSPRTYNGLANGAHELFVRAINTVGVVDATPATLIWTVIEPNTLITLAPPVATTSSDATLDWTANVAFATFECKLDAGAWAACSPTRTYHGLTAGVHTFSVRASLNGLTDPTPASVTWTVIQS